MNYLKVILLVKFENDFNSENSSHETSTLIIDIWYVLCIPIPYTYMWYVTTHTCIDLILTDYYTKPKPIKRGVGTGFSTFGIEENLL